jgi:hypothetical protein
MHQLLHHRQSLGPRIIASCLYEPQFVLWTHHLAIAASSSIPTPRIHPRHPHTPRSEPILPLRTHSRHVEKTQRRSDRAAAPRGQVHGHYRWCDRHRTRNCHWLPYARRQCRGQPLRRPQVLRAVPDTPQRGITELGRQGSSSEPADRSSWRCRRSRDWQEACCSCSRKMGTPRRVH